MNISKELSNPTSIRHSDQYHWGTSMQDFPPNVVETSWTWCMGNPAELNMSAAVNGKIVLVNSSSWRISRRTLAFGTFFVKLVAAVVFGNGSSPYQTVPLYDYGYMEIVRSHLEARINGGSAILWPFNDTVTANGSLSYDPDKGPWNYDGLTFNWSCCKSGSLAFSLDCFHAFTSGAETRAVSADTSKLTVNASYVIRLVVSGAGRNTTDEQTVTVVKGNFPRVELRCFADCGKVVNPSAKLRLTTSCTNPACTGAGYEWQLHIKDAIGPSWAAVSNLRGMMSTPRDCTNIVIREDALLMGREFRIKVVVKSLGGFSGFALHEFRTATLPSGGTCSTTPTSGMSLVTIFNFKCEGWNDEDPPLSYRFRYLTLKGTYAIVASGPSSVLSTLLSAGPAERNYTKEFEIIIRNVAGVSAKITIKVQVKSADKLNFCLTKRTEVERTLESLVLGRHNLIDGNLKDGNVGGATQIAIAVLHELRNGANCSDKLTEGLVKSVTDAITGKIRNLKANELDGLTQILSVEGEITTSLDSFCKECQAATLDMTSNAIKSFAAVVEDMQEAENEDYMAIATNIVSVLGNVLELISKEFNNTSTKEASERAMENGHETASILLMRTVPGETKVTIIAGMLELTAQRSIPSSLKNFSLATGNTSVKLPDMGNTIGDYEHVDVQMLSLGKNPYTHNSSSQEITSGVVSIELKDPKKSSIPVTGLSQDITITIPSTPIDEEEAPNKGFAKPFIMKYHQIHIDREGTAIKLNLKPSMNTAKMAVFAKQNGRPSMSDYEQHFTIPDTSKCAKGNLQDCPRGDPYSVTLVASKRGTLSVGIYYVDEDNKADKHSRGKRSCFGHGRQKRSCIGIKDPPPKGFNRTVIPVYDPKTDVNYTLGISQTSCLYWSDEEQTWTSAGCKAGTSSTAFALTCRCNHLSSFGGNVVVAPNPIDFDKVFVEFTNLGESGNVAVLVTICCVFGLYFVVVFFARKADRHDQAKVGPPEYLKDEDGENTYEYEIVINTGVWRNSGTTSNICITIKGAEGDSDPISLGNKMDPARVRFARGCLDPFIVTVPESLGQLTNVVVSHDNSGVNPSWFLENIAIRDRQTGDQWIFHVNRWLALEKGDGHIEVTVPIVRQQANGNFSELFKSKAPRQMMESHLWLSVATKVSSSTFTRVQRASCCLSMMLCAMVTNAMFYNMSGETDETIRMGPFKFSVKQIVVGIQSGLIVAPINILIVFLFKNVKPRATKAGQGYQEETKAPLLVEELRETTRGLPRLLVYVAWFLCISSALAAAAFTFFYSLMWGKEVSEQWLSSIMISIVQDVVFLQPSKAVMLIGVVVFALTFRRKDDDEPLEEDLPESPSDDLPENELRNYELEQLRKRKKMEAKVMRFGMDVLWHLIFMLLLAVVCYGNKDENRFLMTRSVKQALPYKATHPEMFRSWTKNFFIPSVYAGYWYNDLKETQEVYVGNKKSILVGMPRMRQLRVMKEPCPPVPLHPENCSYDYSTEREDKTELSLPGWRRLPANISWPVALDMCPKPWRYHSAQELDTLPIWGAYHLYEGGGYPARMGYDAQTAERVLEETIPRSWIDRQTRVVMVEFTIFNVNTNLISIGSYLYEVLPTGYATARGIVDTLTLYSTESSFYEFYLICQFLFMVMLLCLLVKQFMRMYRQRWSYFRCLWNWVELLQIVFSVLSVIIYTLRAKSILHSIRKIQENPYANVGFHDAIMWAFWEDTVLSLAIFLATFKLLHLIRVNPHILIMSSSLKECLSPLFSFFIVFVVIFFNFAQSGILIFGNGVYMYSTFTRAVVSQFEFLLGKAVPLEGLQRENRILGPIFSFTYMGIMTVLMMNFFIAIISDSYEDVREDVEERADQMEMAKYMNEQLIGMVFSKNSKKNNPSLVSKKLFCDEPHDGANMCVFEAEPCCINSDNIIENSLERLARIEAKVSKLAKFHRFADEDMASEKREAASLLEHALTTTVPLDDKLAILTALKEV